ncbi:hypothetical protein [Micromonospora fluostatini]|uniref:hypothetical protein n=1 Tax=Micromonospora sp. JCM 30529 TaxID=3421643 RepID=UPI003D18494E
MARRLFALERYDRVAGEDADDAIDRLTTGTTRLRGAVRLPTDGVVLALVEGPDAQTVAAVAAAARWRVDRLGPAEWLGSAELLGPAELLGRAEPIGPAEPRGPADSLSAPESPAPGTGGDLP